jgi:hypothetical protein
MDGGYGGRGILPSPRFEKVGVSAPEVAFHWRVRVPWSDSRSPKALWWTSDRPAKWLDESVITFAGDCGYSGVYAVDSFRLYENVTPAFKRSGKVRTDVRWASNKPRCPRN